MPRALGDGSSDFFNDDGFGLDDDPNGIDCNAFDSSRLIFRAPVTGTYTFRADGFGSSTGPYSLTIITTPRADLDFDGDNTSDPALYRGSTGAFFIGQSFDTSLLQLCCADPSQGDVPLPADYDGDFKDDIAVYRGSTGAFFIFRSSDSTFDQLCCADPSQGDRPLPADYDGDGKADIAVYRESNGAFLVFRSSDSTLVQQCCADPSLGDQPIPADY
ncbi:MAG: FG-GAP-like repeat-containing protein, partial [Candidatus Rokuibacteriota bacterium]